MAQVSIQFERPERYEVWALTVGGKRLAEVPSKTAGDRLLFTADVGADLTNGARMLYEIVIK
jgi:hypothetical protein